MQEVTGNLWTYPADLRVITTNGTVKKNGECVMGRGCALEAVKGTKHNGSWPGLPRMLGAAIESDGNDVHILGACVTPCDGLLVSFPVKHNWFERADLRLIERSASQLVAYVDQEWSRGDCQPRIVLPRPGCGNGGLRWEDVKPVLEPILDDRFHVITFK
jgi:hypothetical protein